MGDLNILMHGYIRCGRQECYVFLKSIHGQPHSTSVKHENTVCCVYPACICLPIDVVCIGSNRDIDNNNRRDDDNVDNDENDVGH